jgi:hypothetical protein
MFEAPGFALIGWTLSLARTPAVDEDGVVAASVVAAGLDDDTGGATASSPEASHGIDDSKPTAHSIIPAVARTCRLIERFI